MEFYPAPMGSGRILSQTEYWKSEVKPFLRFCVLGGGFVCLFMGLMTVFSLGILGLLDGLVVLGLGYGICFRRSRACAVVAGAYYAINQLMLRISPLGAMAGGTSAIVYIFLALLILSIYGTFTFQSNYAEYVASKQAPPDDESAQGFD